MSKFTEGRPSVPGTVTGMFRISALSGDTGVFCFGPFGVGVVLDEAYVKVTCNAGTTPYLTLALALVRTPAETAENFAAGMSLVQGDGTDLMGQQGYVRRFIVREVDDWRIHPQVPVRESQVWLALGWSIFEAAGFDGLVVVRTVWPGFYGGERPVVIQEKEPE